MCASTSLLAVASAAASWLVRAELAEAEMEGVQPRSPSNHIDTPARRQEEGNPVFVMVFFGQLDTT
eukprot:m.131058 g.131058  ORF g.131058 m.131058 type:complete len:66 (-) comp22400_c0_seq1:315-512(-)